jgi:hypothetical protein
MRLGSALIVTAFAVLTAAGFAACKVTGDSAGGGDKAGFPSLTGAGIPYLSALSLSPVSGGEPLELSPVFDPNVLLYEADLASYEAMIGISIQGADFNIDAEVPPEHESGQNEWSISYPGGQNTVQTVDGGQAVVYVEDGSITTTYIISFRGTAAQNKAKLQGISFNPVEFTITPPFNPNINEYTVVLPQTDEVLITPTPAQTGSYTNFNPSYKPDLRIFNKVSVGVTATGYSNNSYTFNFQFSAQESFLDSLSISGGHLEDPSGIIGDAISFSPDIRDYTLVIPRSVTDLYIVGVVNSGSVSYSEGPLIRQPVDGQYITVTANYGVGFTAKDYHFTIEKSDLAVAKLSSLNVITSPAGSAYTLKQMAGGVEIGSNLSDSVFTYNVNFAVKQTGDVSIQAVAADGAFMVLNWGTAESTNGEISRERPGSTDPVTPPLYITVYKSDMLASTYTITFSDSGARAPAQLSALNCYGFTLDRTFNGSESNYTGRMPYGTPFITLQGVVDNSGFNISYSPGNTISSPQNGQEITITVSGGPAYTDKQYKVTIEHILPVSLDLSYAFGGNDKTVTLSNVPVTVFVPALINDVLITGATATRNGLTLSGAGISYSPANSVSWSGVSDFASHIITISVTHSSLSAAQDFTFVLARQNIELMTMASGGTTTFITNADSSVDELHTFNYSGTSNQASYTLTMNRASSSAKVLVIAGGGGGGGSWGAGYGGGGGAGGVIYKTGYTLQPGSFEVKVGKGGGGGSYGNNSNATSGANGQNSVFGELTALGGGGGGYERSGYQHDGEKGGSGGGGSYYSYGGAAQYWNGSQAVTATGTGLSDTRQGHKGGDSRYNSNSAGGGGGAGGEGQANSSGGVGVQIDISGSNVYYAGGGRGRNGSAGTGYDNAGGGGNGYRDSGVAPTAGKNGLVIVRIKWEP